MGPEMGGLTNVALLASVMVVVVGYRRGKYTALLKKEYICMYYRIVPIRGPGPNRGAGVLLSEKYWLRESF